MKIIIINDINILFQNDIAVMQQLYSNNNNNNNKQAYPTYMVENLYHEGIPVGYVLRPNVSYRIPMMAIPTPPTVVDLKLHLGSTQSTTNETTTIETTKN